MTRGHRGNRLAILTNGGGAANVIPPHPSMQGYARAATKARLDELLERMTAQFEAAARATK